MGTQKIVSFQKQSFFIRHEMSRPDMSKTTTDAIVEVEPVPQTAEGIPTMDQTVSKIFQGELFDGYTNYDRLIDECNEKKAEYYRLIGEAGAEANIDLAVHYCKMWGHGNDDDLGNTNLIYFGETCLKKIVETFIELLDQGTPIKDFFNKSQPRQIIIDAVLNGMSVIEDEDLEAINIVIDEILDLYMLELDKDIEHFKRLIKSIDE